MTYWSKCSLTESLKERERYPYNLRISGRGNAHCQSSQARGCSLIDGARFRAWLLLTRPQSSLSLLLILTREAHSRGVRGVLGRRKEERLSPFCFPPSHHSFALSRDTRAIQIEKTGDESVVALYLKPRANTRTQHCWPATPNIVGGCCVRLYVA